MHCCGSSRTCTVVRKLLSHLARSLLPFASLVPRASDRAMRGGMEAAKDRRRRKGSSGHVVAQLLDSPLPTPRRSCCGSAADAPTPRRGSGADASSPQRRHVPFSWESSPGVPKTVAGKEEREVPPPKLPPGWCGAPCRAYHSNTTDAGSDDEEDDDTFSDALDRTSSSDRLAALSARLSAIDGVAGSRCSPSFIMDRFLPAANAIATTSADKHPRRSSSPRRSKLDKVAEAAARARHVTNAPRRALDGERPIHPPPRQSKDAAAAPPAQLRPRINEEAQDDQMSPRVCGLMFFFPWSAKPVLLGFPRSPARCRTPHAGVAAPSPPRRSVTLGDFLEKERKLRDGDLSRWYDEKSGSGKEWSSLRWGTALLGTSKRYCGDARKALSRLALSATDGGGTPRVGRERRSGKPAAAEMLRSTSGKIPPLSPPSDSWLSHARGSNGLNSKR